MLRTDMGHFLREARHLPRNFIEKLVRGDEHFACLAGRLGDVRACRQVPAANAALTRWISAMAASGLEVRIMMSMIAMEFPFFT